MAERIHLPSYHATSNSKAHVFPFQIAEHTLKFIQTVIFWHICVDAAAGITLTNPNGLKRVESALLTEGMQSNEWNTGWEQLGEYKTLFKDIIFKNVLISIRSQWDWYINKLSRFIIFAHNYSENILSSKTTTALQRITFNEITEQISIIKDACGIELNISNETLRHIREMALVRNLGLHNQWEVDDFYLSKAIEPDRWHVGDIRTFDNIELQMWHKCFIDLISATWKPIAIKYASIPQYPPDNE